MTCLVLSVQLQSCVKVTAAFPAAGGLLPESQQQCGRGRKPRGPHPGAPPPPLEHHPSGRHLLLPHPGSGPGGQR